MAGAPEQPDAPATAGRHGLVWSPRDNFHLSSLDNAPALASLIP